MLPERKGSSWKNGNMTDFHLIFNEMSVGKCFANYLFV